MEISVGLRVVRGPDWTWKEQDGGEGCVGTVVEVRPGNQAESPAGTSPKSVVVQWDCGRHYRSKYHCGENGKYNLRVLDSGPTGLKHPHLPCNWCRVNEIAGMLWKCTRCVDYFLCTACYMAGKHSLEHKFERIDGSDLKMRTSLCPRYCAARLQAKGLFKDAEVARGHDWAWEDQDGGEGRPGRIVSVQDWRETARSVAAVQWMESHGKNVYRVGLNGKVDLKCITSASGGFYFPQHLPVLGTPHVPPETPVISAGDAVRVELDPDVFKIAQEDHGGWNDMMAEFIGRIGAVSTIQYHGDIVVRYSNNKIFLFNPQVLTKVDVPQFDFGDVVRVLHDIVTVHNLQTGHGEWIDDMALALGQVGRVMNVQPNSDVRVAVNGRRWTLNPYCLVPAPGEIPVEEKCDGMPIERGLKLHLRSLMEAECPDVVPTAVAAGDAETIIQFLTKFPYEVNTKLEGKGPLHIAAVEGYVPVLRALLQFSPDLEMEDDNGERPLHLCAYNNNAIVARILLDAGADVNSRDSRGVTAISIAAAVGHYDVMKILAFYPGVDLNFQDEEGKTPLHCSIFPHKRKSVEVLLEAGADASLLSFRLFTPIHDAAGFGFLAGMEEFLKYCPRLINTKKDDGFTALHVAVVNGHADIVSLLASHDLCDINARNISQLTPLHLALQEGQIEAVERLIGYGADLNYKTRDGNTPLHIALGRNNMRKPSERTPQIKKIEENLAVSHGHLSANVIVGLFLVQEGAKVDEPNYKGIRPCHLQPSDVTELLQTFARDKCIKSFHRALRSLGNPFTGFPVLTPRPIPQNPPAQVHISETITRAVPKPVGASSPNQMKKSDRATPFNRWSTDKNDLKGATPLECDTVQNKATNKYKYTGPLNPWTPCFLCESPSDMKFKPCGHVVMCRECVRRAKKCPDEDCRKVVQGSSNVCPLCKETEPSFIFKACGHHYCSKCVKEAEDLSKCLLCGKKNE